MSYYWISWQQPTDDERPLTFPPNPGVLGWWNTGCGDDYWTLCAMVKAEDEGAAKSVVLIDWPEAENWRFANFMEEPIIRTDRFPPSDWMTDRGLIIE